ncbi:TetR/AcrR family transcriptional regulator [Rothia sp. ZJ1223]|uniref:TetR/AcrR family transcriptional regulator n=1 Tax=Rothia sp. ZJ1223 TaxID=2811098 RepID=UPI0019565C2B|nr:TetR/AcrR family transcriptional regulator [Rothia sp. ZJ1223]MBM7051085.1 TetR/AcrR family transcriptional regulator [Rothia sp. ZJ1223]
MTIVDESASPKATSIEEDSRDETSGTLEIQVPRKPIKSAKKKSTRSRKSTVRLPRDTRRRQLIDCSLRVFSAQGYHVTTMEHIAEEAQVSKPVLYQHFNGKQDLYLALLDDQIAQFVAAVSAPLYETEVNRDRVEGVLMAFFKFTRANPQGYRLIFESDVHGDLMVQDKVEGLHRTMAEHIAGILGPNAGLDSQQAVLLSRTLSGMALSATQHALHSGMSPTDLDQVGKLVFKLAWGGVSILDEDWL